MEILSGIAKEIWRTFNQAAPYILLGIFLAGVIRSFVDQEQIAKHLGKKGIKSVILAALFGVPLPLCSCGVLPTAISLRKSGASKAATLSFMISTPESGADSIMLTYALLDPIMTVFRPIAAFITAIAAGISEIFFGKDEEKPVEKQKCASCGENHAHKHGFIYKIKSGMDYAFTALLGDIAVWLIIGISVAGLISYFVPPTFIENYLGQGFAAMLVMLVIGMFLYICASASTPIAAALIAKGMSPGVAIVFLLAGPATNITTMIAVGKFLGKRSLITYLASIAICSILLGLLLNSIYIKFGIDIRSTLGHAGERFPHHAKIFSAAALLLLMGNALIKKRYPLT